MITEHQPIFWILTDEQWAVIKEIILGASKSPKGPKSSPEFERLNLECILWKLAVGVPWYDLPKAYLKATSKPSFNTDETRSTDKFEPEDNSISYPVNYPIPSHQTIYRRYRKWLKSGVINRIIATLTNDLKTRGGFDLIYEITDGDIHFVDDSNRQAWNFSQKKTQSSGTNWKVIIESKGLGDWQHKTALLILCIIAKEVKIAIEKPNFNN